MRSTCRALAVGGLLLTIGTPAAAQIIPAELSEPQFFGSSFTQFFQDRLSPVDQSYSKENPFKLSTPLGTVYAYWFKGDPYLIAGSRGKMDFGAAVALPSDKLVLNDYVWIYSRKDVTLTPDDVPSDLKLRVQKFWPSAKVTLLAKGVVMRAEPAGDLLDDARSFLKLDRIDGVTVLAFGKSSLRNSTSLMFFGTVTNPFGIEMTLRDPELTYTKKEGKPRPTVALASNVDIYGHAYEFKAEGSDPKKPDIFVLKTPSLNPQDVVNISRAFAKPLFDLAPGTNPGWKFNLIPTFSLHPPKTTSPNFPTEDQSKVVVYAAVTDKPEWKVTGPAIKIRGSLQVDLLPKKQDIASVELSLDKSSLAANFALPSFSLPGSELTFGSASAAIGASASNTFMTISAAVDNPCFAQQASFTVDGTGLPKVDVNVNQALSQLDPTTFVGRFRGCSKAGLDVAKLALQSGEQVMGYGRDKLVEVAAPVFGTERVVFVAKALGYPAEIVATGLGKLLGKNDLFDKNALMDVAQKVYGVGEVGKFANSAGLVVQDVLGWASTRGGAQLAGFALNGAGFAKDQLLDISAKVFGSGDMVYFAEGAGFTAEQFMGWASTGGKSVETVGQMFKGGYYDSGKVLDAALKTFKPEQVASFAKSAVYSAEKVVSWANVRKMTPDAIGKLVGQGVFGRDELLNAGNKILGNDKVALIGQGAGYAAKEVYGWAYDAQIKSLGKMPDSWRDVGDAIRWHDSYMRGAGDAAKMIGKVWNKDDVLNGAKDVYKLGWSGVSQIGRVAGFDATAMTHYFNAVGVGKKEISEILFAGGYAKNQVKGAVMTVYRLGSGEVDKLVDAGEAAWSGVADTAKKGCKTLLGWTGAC